ncbi:MAG: ABC transporter permease subunit [Candidatus Thorarchaeota archaeon]
MNERLRRIRAILEFEFDVSFPFPAAEVLSVLLGVLVAMNIIITQRSYFAFLVSPSAFSNSLELERIIFQVTHVDFHLLSTPLFSMTILIIIAVPMLCAFRVAGPLENGVLKAMLSYPIRRRELLILKGIEIMVLICLPITVGSLGAIVLYNGLSVGIEFLLVIVSFWTLVFTILSSSFLLSVITQSSAKATFGGVALWAVLLLVGMFAKIPVVLRGIPNPVILTISYFRGSPIGNQYDITPVLNDVLVSIIGNLLIGIIIFLASIRYFKRVEI